MFSCAFMLDRKLTYRHLIGYFFGHTMILIGWSFFGGQLKPSRGAGSRGKIRRFELGVKNQLPITLIPRSIRG